MPHTASAKKNLRKSEKRRLHNRTVIRALKTQIKKFLAELKAGNLEQAQKEYQLAALKLDRAAAKRVVHPNLASRKKSRLAKMLRAKTNPAPAAAAATKK
jgi:small subunit ribosomal protein S20